jgi:hypothetical protein
LEVVLAVTLTIGFMGTVLWFYESAVSARAAVLRETEIATAERMIMDRLTDELQNAVPSVFLRTGLEGKADSVSFLATNLPGPGAWAKVETTKQPPPPASDVQLVSYRLRTTVDEQGQAQVVGLERAVQALPSAKQTDQSQELAVLLTGQIKFLHLRYWDGQAWQNSWGGGDVPSAVQVVLGVQPLPQDTDPLEYPYETFRRTIFVPAGHKGDGGPRVIGLEEEAGPP